MKKQAKRLERILICEDVPEVGSLLQEALSDQFEVTLGIGYDFCVRLLRENRKKSAEERFSVAVVDLCFKEIGEEAGLGILDEVVQDDLLEAVVFTSTGNEKKAAKSIRMGAFEYVARVQDPENEYDSGERRLKSERQSGDKRVRMKSDSRFGDSISELRRAIAEAIECRKALSDLISLLDRLEVIDGVGPDIKALAYRVLGYIKKIRGRVRL